jgi:hypothetical protein
VPCKYDNKDLELNLQRGGTTKGKNAKIKENSLLSGIRKEEHFKSSHNLDRKRVKSFEKVFVPKIKGVIESTWKFNDIANFQ